MFRSKHHLPVSSLRSAELRGFSKAEPILCRYAIQEGMFMLFKNHRNAVTTFVLSTAALALPALLSAQPIRVGEDEARKAALQKTQPTYPPIARQMNLSGRVLLDVTVDTAGSVEKVDVVSGNPILAGSASQAAKQWKFQPFTADGKATEAVIRIGFDFSR
jgi:protein TonB